MEGIRCNTRIGLDARIEHYQNQHTQSTIKSVYQSQFKIPIEQSLQSKAKTNQDNSSMSLSSTTHGKGKRHEVTPPTAKGARQPGSIDRARN
jgi:hypothetical protein